MGKGRAGALLGRNACMGLAAEGHYRTAQKQPRVADHNLVLQKTRRTTHLLDHGIQLGLRRSYTGGAHGASVRWQWGSLARQRCARYVPRKDARDGLSPGWQICCGWAHSRLAGTASLGIVPTAFLLLSGPVPSL